MATAARAFKMPTGPFAPIRTSRMGAFGRAPAGGRRRVGTRVSRQRPIRRADGGVVAGRRLAVAAARGRVLAANVRHPDEPDGGV